MGVALEPHTVARACQSSSVMSESGLTLTDVIPLVAASPTASCTGGIALDDPAGGVAGPVQGRGHLPEQCEVLLPVVDTAEEQLGHGDLAGGAALTEGGDVLHEALAHLAPGELVGGGEIPGADGVGGGPCEGGVSEIQAGTYAFVEEV